MTAPAMHDCIVVGAGAAGLTAANVLQRNGKRVLVIDKGRGVGGRVATRRTGEYRFDHGAQALYGVSQELQALLSGWLDASAFRPCVYTPRPSEPPLTYGPYAGVNGLSTIARSLAAGLAVQTAVRIDAIRRDNGCWQLRSQSGDEYLGRSVIMTPPAPQILGLIEKSNLEIPPDLHQALQSITYESCLALMVAADPAVSRIETTFLRPDHGCVELLVDNYAKGVSPRAGAITLHAGPAFSRAMFEEHDEDIACRMLDDVRGYIDVSHVTWQLHRWRFSRAVTRSGEPFLVTRQPEPLYFAGDGFGPGGIEGAIRSGYQAATDILGRSY